MNRKMLVPSGISALRLAALPLFLYFFFNAQTTLALLVFACGAVTDLFDGFLARKLGAASKFGAYLDASTDFVFLLGAFAAFTITGYYSPWMLVLIVASFAQFLISSLYTKRLYDPLGKYLGSALYVAIALTLLSPANFIFTVVQLGFFVFAATSFVTRTASLAAASHKIRQPQKISPKHHKTHTA